MSDDVIHQEDWKFSGFRFPSYTQVPDQLFDELLPILSGGELKALLYICRRTFGFKRESDNISLNQMLNGITKEDGSQLDLGTGLSKPTLLRALKSLQDKEILIAERRANEQKGDLATNYRLHMANTPWSKNEPTPGKKMSLGEAQNFTKPLVKKYYPQHTVVQQTDLQQTDLQQTTTTDDVDGENNDSSAMDKNVVVAFLQKQGVSGAVAKRLAENFDAEIINEKIEFVEFLVAEGRVKNPAGWLRTAIEEDYAKPDGFLSQAEREQLAQSEALRAQEVAESVVRREEEFQRKENERERAQAEFEKRLHARYGTSEKERELWRAVLAQAGGQFSPSIYAILQSCYLLTLQNDIALVGIETEYQHRQLQHPGIAVVLKRLLRALIGEELEIEFVLLDKT